MTVWDELKVALLELQESHALASHPSLSSDEGRQPPFSIDLQPWATEVAAELHRRFGDNVKLVVGWLSYPECRLPRSPVRIPPAVAELDTRKMTVELDAPVVVSSGHNVRGGLRVQNLTREPMLIRTNGQVTACVIDPQTREIVGGFSGAQTMPAITFRVAPNGSELIPMLVGTASRSPELGYAVPAGQWAVQVVLSFVETEGWAGWRKHRNQAGSRGFLTPPLPITVTD